jgi:RNA polymerase sigma factor (sigma-70 family)
MSRSASQVIEYVRRIAAPESDLSDGQLLDRFVASRDESAFRQLLQRHASTVLGVCRRLLANAHDAEDAFQATFFVLARKAESVRPRHMVGNWLYGVAYRIAWKARAAALRRRVKEQEAGSQRTEPSLPGDWQELRMLLDRELSRLPEKYRSAVVLCELGGTSRKEAARQLGLAEGTLSSRLAAARVRLARRLSRYGALVSAGSLAVLLEQEASARVSASLLRETSALAGRAIAPGVISANVTALAEGVISNMWLNNGKWALSAAIVTIGLGAGLLSLPALSSRPSSGLSAAEPAQKDKKEQGPVVRGVITAIDAGKSTMTLKVQIAADKKQTEEKTLTLAKDVNVLLNTHPTKKQQLPAGKMTDLTPGTHVDARLSPDSKAVVEVIATGPNIHAGFKSFAAAQNTLTVYVKGQDGKEDKTLQVAKDAKVLLNDGLSKGTPDQEGKLSDLAEGTSVGLQLSVDQKTALTIRAFGGSLHGTLKALDTGNSSVTISVKEDGGLVDKELKLVKGAKIEGNPTVGGGVSVTLSVFDKGVATFVRARD